MFLEDASEGQRRRVEHVRSRIEKHFKIHEAPGFDEARARISLASRRGAQLPLALLA